MKTPSSNARSIAFALVAVLLCATTFAQNCTPIAHSALPFTEGFETYPAYYSLMTPHDCWYGSNLHIQDGSWIIHSGNRSLEMRANSWIILPEFADSLQDLSISFWSQSALAPQVHVGVVTNPQDITTFQEVQSFSNDAQYSQHIAYFTNYTGPQGHIALYIPTGGSTYCYIDDISVQPLPPCPEPQNLTATSITESSAMLHWTEFGNATTWRVEYGPAGFDRGSGTIVTAYADSLLVTGLINGRVYDFYVTPVGCSSYSKGTFLTSCGEAATLPFNEGFEGYNNLDVPACWTFINPSEFNNTYIHHDSTMAYNSHNYLRINNDDESLATPRIPLPANSISLSLMLRNYSSSTATLSIGFTTSLSPSATIIPVTTLQPTNTYTRYNVNFSSLNITDTGYVVFTLNTGSWALGIDDVSISAIGSDPCLDIPTNLQCSNFTHNQASVQWQGNGASYQVRWYDAEAGSSTQQTILTATNHYLLSNLTPNTRYLISVRSICSNDDTGVYCPNIYVRTRCDGPVEVPYYEDFNTPDATVPNCWSYICRFDYSTYIYTVSGNNVAYEGQSLAMKASRAVHSFSVLPLMSEPLRHLKISMQLGSANSEGSKLMIGATVDPTDTSNIIILDSALLHARVFNHFEHSFSNDTQLDTDTDYHIVLYHKVVGGSMLTAYIDSLYIQPDYSCDAPDSVAVSNISESSAQLGWQGTADSYEVSLWERFSTNVQTLTTATTQLALNDLQPGATYLVTVRSICAQEYSSHWGDTLEFLTPLCSDERSDTLSNPEAIPTSTLPFATDYTYSTTEQLYLADELPDLNSIRAFSLQMSYDVPMTMTTDYTVYMANTSIASFSDIVARVPAGGLTEVYRGSLNCHEGWNRFTLHTPFQRDTTQNLVVVIQGSHSGSQEYPILFQAFATEEPLTIYANSNSDPVDPNSNLIDFHATSLRSCMIFHSCASDAPLTGITPAGSSSCRVYPNPATKFVDVELSGISHAQVSLYNAAGQLVMTRQATTSKLRLDLGSLPKGVYLLQVAATEGISTHKVVLQ